MTSPWFADYGTGFRTRVTMRLSLAQFPWRLLLPTGLGLLTGGLLGWLIGRQALRGIRAPETAPVLASQSGQKSTGFRAEAEVLKRIQTRMSRVAASAGPAAENKPSPEKGKAPSAVPLHPSRLKLQVQTTQLSPDQLTWTVALKNEGDRPYALLGSNLEVRDDQGRTSVIEPLDLPAEIVAGEQLTGQFRVPLLLLEGARQLRLYGAGLPPAGIDLPLPSRPLTVPLPPPNPFPNPPSDASLP
jgi:hypothetical protein